MAGPDSSNPFITSRPGIRVVPFYLALLVISCCSPSDDHEVSRYLRRGDDYVGQQQFAQAVIDYKNAARAAPNNTAIQWKLAQAALKTKEFATAISALQRLTAMSPTDYEPKDHLGQLFLMAGNVREARKLADDLITTHPHRPAGYLLLGRLAARDGELPTAIGQLLQAVERDPKNDNTMVAVGNLYLLQHDSRQAYAWYDRALAGNPDSIKAHIARGNLYLSAGRQAEGNKDFRDAVEVAKNSEETRLMIAAEHLVQDRLRHAEEELEAITHAMQSKKAQVLLVQVKLDLGKISEAKPLVAGLAKDSPDATVAYLLGRMALAEERTKEARIWLEDAARRQPRMASVHVYLGVLDLLQGRRTDGEQQLLEAVKLNPANPKPHLVLAELYFNEQSYAKAEREAFEVLRRYPAHVRAATLYGDTFLLRDEWARAEAVYSALLTQLPENPIGAVKMAIMRRRLGLTAEAANFFAEAVKRSPQDPALMSEYLLALVAADQTSKAEHLVKDYVAKAPREAVRWQIAGQVYMAARHPADAEHTLKKAVELAPNNPLPLYELAHLYLWQHNLPVAETEFRKVLELDTSQARAHTALGIVLAAQGRSDEANEHYRRAIELQPKDYVAANDLAVDLVAPIAALDQALGYGERIERRRTHPE